MSPLLPRIVLLTKRVRRNVPAHRGAAAIPRSSLYSATSALISTTEHIISGGHARATSPAPPRRRAGRAPADRSRAQAPGCDLAVRSGRRRGRLDDATEPGDVRPLSRGDRAPAVGPEEARVSYCPGRRYCVSARSAEGLPMKRHSARTAVTLAVSILIAGSACAPTAVNPGGGTAGGGAAGTAAGGGAGGASATGGTTAGAAGAAGTTGGAAGGSAGSAAAADRAAQDRRRHHGQRGRRRQRRRRGTHGGRPRRTRAARRAAAAAAPDRGGPRRRHGRGRRHRHRAAAEAARPARRRSRCRCSSRAR